MRLYGNAVPLILLASAVVWRIEPLPSINGMKVQHTDFLAPITAVAKLFRLVRLSLPVLNVMRCRIGRILGLNIDLEGSS